MKTNLTLKEIRFIITSLDFTVQHFREYQNYPSPKFKKKRINYAKDVRQKVRNLRDELKGGKDEIENPRNSS